MWLLRALQICEELTDEREQSGIFEGHYEEIDVCQTGTCFEVAKRTTDARVLTTVFNEDLQHRLSKKGREDGK